MCIDLPALQCNSSLLPAFTINRYWFEHTEIGKHLTQEPRGTEVYFVGVLGVLMF